MYQHCLELAKQITESYRKKFWAAADAVCKGTPPPPVVPDYAASTRAGILADVETLPARKQIEAAARAGTAGTTMIGDKSIDFDFTGIGDLDQQVTLLEGQRRSADTMAQVALDIQKKYGADFLDQSLKRIEQSDPTGTKVRKRLAEITLAELDKGMQLSDEEIRFAEQAFRRSSTARGASQIGTAPAIQETLAQYNMGRQLLGQRMNMARSYMGMPQTAQFGQIAGSQQGAAPFMAQQLQQGIGQNAGAGAAGAGFATNVYSTQASIYGTQMANRSDPMGTILGGLASVGMTAATGGIGGALAGTGIRAGIGSAFFGNK
jgi:hypothetical protein